MGPILNTPSWYDALREAVTIQSLVLYKISERIDY